MRNSISPRILTLGALLTVKANPATVRYSRKKDVTGQSLVEKAKFAHVVNGSRIKLLKATQQLFAIVFTRRNSSRVSMSLSKFIIPTSFL